MALPKDVDWRILSHCDGQAVRKEVEYGDRDAMTFLRLRPLGSFLTQCDKNRQKQNKRTHLVATGRLCLSKPLCPAISNCRIVFWIMLFWYRKVIRKSVYSMMFRKFLWDPRGSRSRRESCQLWCFRSTRAESLQNFIISKHMVATGTLCLSKPLCPTISNCRIVFWIMLFWYRKVIRVSVYSMMFRKFFWDPRGSRSRRGSCQVWFCRTTRAEHLQNFIMRTHMVPTGRLCLSKPLCPTISICRIVIWIMLFWHQKVVRVSVYPKN